MYKITVSIEISQVIENFYKIIRKNKTRLFFMFMKIFRFGKVKPCVPQTNLIIFNFNLK